MNAAVITGLGVVSPFGFGAAAFFDGLLSAETAVRPIASFDASTLPTRWAAEVPVARFEPGGLATALGRDADDPLFRRTWQQGVFRDRKVTWACLALREALRAADLPIEDRNAPLCVGLGLEQALLEDFAPVFEDGQIAWSREPEADLPPTRFRTPIDLAARTMRQLFALGGPCSVNVSACAAGALAIAHGASLIRRGEAPVVLCGGADAMINPLGLGGMIRLGATSPRNAPDACRPFDRARDGLVLGEGAAMFVLESEAHAAARGSRTLARIAGWGSSQDGHRATAPRPDGAAARRAITRALSVAGVRAEDVDHVNAHGTGTPLNDPAEARALLDALGARGREVPVCSIKGAIGHLMAASGAIELAASLLPFERGWLPGTVHHRDTDPDCPLNVLGPRPVRSGARYVLSNSFGFGGQNAALLLGAP